MTTDRNETVKLWIWNPPERQKYDPSENFCNTVWTECHSQVAGTFISRLEVRYPSKD